jgi:hypothetical protein
VKETDRLARERVTRAGVGSGFGWSTSAIARLRGPFPRGVGAGRVDGVGMGAPPETAPCEVVEGGFGVPAFFFDAAAGVFGAAVDEDAVPPARVELAVAAGGSEAAEAAGAAFLVAGLTVRATGRGLASKRERQPHWAARGRRRTRGLSSKRQSLRQRDLLLWLSRTMTPERSR